MRRSSRTSISHADDADQQRRQHHAAPEAERARRPEARHQRPGDVGAQHVERAVREVHDPRDAEDDRQPRGDEEQRGRARQPVQGLDEDEVHGAMRQLHRHRGFATRPLGPSAAGERREPQGRTLAPRTAGSGSRASAPARRSEDERGALASSTRRPQRLHHVVGRQVLGAVAIAPVDHHALAVLDVEPADVGAQRRLMVDGAILDRRRTRWRTSARAWRR